MKKTIVCPDEVLLKYELIDGLHYYFGNDVWSQGLFIVADTKEEAESEALIILRILLRMNHNIDVGDWEVFLINN